MQSINFTMLAPSGSGGAFFTELLDDNWSEDYTRLVDNYRNPKLNEYAGSPNAVRLEFIDLDYEFNENSILLGKNDSPVEFFKSKITCETTYIIDIEGHEELLKDLVFLKKIIGSSWEDSTPHELSCCFNSNGNLIERNTKETHVSWNKFKKMCNDISDLICPTSTSAISYYLRNEPEEKTFRNWLSDEYERFVLSDRFVKPIEDSIYAEIGDYTNIITVKYSDILKGKVHHSKKQIDEYVERNTELLDRMFLDFDIC
tara:strand:- start:240 stop:1013 length:774 start_codon:yes stop_codon:yes gene_type:complete